MTALRGFAQNNSCCGMLEPWCTMGLLMAEVVRMREADSMMQGQARCRRDRQPIFRVCHPCRLLC